MPATNGGPRSLGQAVQVGGRVVGMCVQTQPARANRLVETSGGACAVSGLESHHVNGGAPRGARNVKQDVATP